MADSTSSPEMHPPIEDLQAFALGLGTATDSETIADHLGLCPQCEGHVCQIQSDGFLTLVRKAAESNPPSTALPHRIVPGYEVLEELGRGGMGVVVLARQPGLGRLVAFKQLRSGRLATGEERMRFRREAEALGRLDHPNIVRVYDSGEQDQIPYLAMEYIRGMTLAQRLKTGPLDPRVAAELTCLLSRAVAYSHASGIVHRDLKPGNILLQPASDSLQGLGIPKITDFGLARPVGLQPLIGSNDQTVSGTLIGTPSYMAPEQISGSDLSGLPAADLFSLGAIFYETLTGQPPFRGKSVLETLDQVRHRILTPPSEIDRRIPPELDRICQRCLQKHPSDRYPNAEALASDLQRFLVSESIPVRLSRPLASIPTSKARTWLLLGSVILVILLIFGFTSGQLWSPEHVASPPITDLVPPTIELPDLAIWLRADRGLELDDSGGVRRWTDQSPSGRHDAVQLMQDYRPKLMQAEAHAPPFLRFDGIDDSLDLSGELIHSQAFTIIAVVSHPPGYEGSHILLSNWDDANTHNSVFVGVMNLDGLFPRFTDEIGGVTDENIQLTRRALIPDSDQWFLITARSSATTAEVYINSTRLISTERPLARRDFGGVWRIGTQGPGWEYWHGDVAEIAAYDRALEQSEMDAVWSQLRQRYFFPTSRSP